MYERGSRPGPFFKVASSVPLTSTMCRPMRPITMRPIGCPTFTVAAVGARVGGDGALLGCEVAALDGDRVVRSKVVGELRRELPLLPVRVERGERVLPAPDDDRPGERQDTYRQEGGACDPSSPMHLSRVTRDAAMQLRAAGGGRASTSPRIVWRSGPRGGRSAALGYGA